MTTEVPEDVIETTDEVPEAPSVNADIETLAAEPVAVTLVSGLEIEVLPLKTRALMSLLKILTRGAMGALDGLSFSEDMSTEEFTGQLLMSVAMSIPEAEDETIQFVNRMVTIPGDMGPRPSKQEVEERANKEIQLQRELKDPELDDLLTIVSEIVKNEAPHILALGKRLSVLMEAQKMSLSAKQGASSQRSYGS